MIPLSKIIIATKHAGAVEWLRRHHPDIAQATIKPYLTPEEARGKVLVGNVPYQIAAAADEMWAIEFVGTPPRGSEYSADEMERAGARLSRYVVRRVE